VNINYDYIEEYIRSILKGGYGELSRLRDYANNNNIPIISPEVEQFIRILLKVSDAKNILELGTAIGYSALIMAEAANPDAKITTIEVRDDMYEMAKENISANKYSKRIRLIKGDAKEVVPKLNERYDFVFLDAAKGHYLGFFKDCIKKLNYGGIVVSDNVLYRGMVAKDELINKRDKTIVRRMRNYLDYISNLDGYITSVIPLCDGVALTYKEG